MACTYCYKGGHNRRTCEDLTKRLEAQSERGSLYAQRELRRRGKGKGTKKLNRTCSFCELRGHDRRTCKILKEYIAACVEDVHTARQKVFDRCAQQDFGPGSLVKFRYRAWVDQSGFEDFDRVGVVKKIRWDLLDEYSWPSGGEYVEVMWSEHDERLKPKAAGHAVTCADSKMRTKHVPLPVKIIFEDDNPHIETFAKDARFSTILVESETVKKDENFEKKIINNFVMQRIKNNDENLWTYAVQNKLGKGNIENLVSDIVAEQKRTKNDGV